ncbi:hypothetical protein [Alloactinosynnema sp. L-07]|uniref:hypothetical protein n=1 Tax=Alloactinosynnema sp. L-07 TaxID=1653480 RepID=UPI0012FA7E80|nr:hypothetical protein [Alloactinosynnema sp. L-07]
MLQRITGVDRVDDVRLFGANPITGDMEAVQQLDLQTNALVYSLRHQVQVVS